MPIGVVIGLFSATPFTGLDSSVSFEAGEPPPSRRRPPGGRPSRTRLPSPRGRGGWLPWELRPGPVSGNEATVEGPSARRWYLHACSIPVRRALPDERGRGLRRDSKASSRSRRRSPEPDREGGSSATAVSTSRSPSAASRTRRSGATRRREPRAGHARARCLRSACPHRERAWPTRRPRSPRLSGVGLGKMTEISDEQARDDLGAARRRRSSIVACSRFASRTATRIPCATTSSWPARPRPSGSCLLARRGGSTARDRDRHVLDLHRRARPQCVDVHARVATSTGADAGAAMSAAIGTLSGPLHGGAPAHVIPMIDEVAAAGDAQTYVDDLPHPGGQDHGLRPPGRSSRGSSCPAARARRTSLARGGSRCSRVVESGCAVGIAGASPGARAGHERRVPGGARARRREIPCAPHSCDVRVLSRRRLVGAHPRAEASGPPDPPSARYAGPGPVPLVG